MIADWSEPRITKIACFLTKLCPERRTTYVCVASLGVRLVFLTGFQVENIYFTMVIQLSKVICFESVLDYMLVFIWFHLVFVTMHAIAALLCDRHKFSWTSCLGSTFFGSELTLSEPPPAPGRGLMGRTKHLACPCARRRWSNIGSTSGIHPINIIHQSCIGLHTVTIK